MRHGVRRRNGSLRAGEEGLREPRGQEIATFPLSTGSVQLMSCSFCPTCLIFLMELSLGTREEHPCSDPGTSLRHFIEKVVTPVIETVPGPTCLQCPAMSWLVSQH